MKQIFTLLTALSLTSAFSLKANSQNINESFESPAAVTNLVTSCWTLNNFNYTNVSPLVGVGGSVVSTQGVLSEIITPELQIPSTLNISFTYNTVTSTTGSKTLKIFLDINGSETLLESINLQSNPSGTFISPAYTNANTPGNNINGSRKIIFRVTDNVSVKIDGLTINAPYTYAGGCPFANIPLPVKLLNFQGNLSKTQAQLNWTVAENETGNYFEVERSNDGKNFTTVAVVSTTQKQGNESYMYSEALVTAYYRLRIVNKDKSASYSKVLLIKSQTTTANTVNLYQNPIQETLTFSFTSASNASNEIAVYNLVGAKVYAEKLLAQKGMNSVSINLNSYLTSGTYILEVRNSTERSIAKFIKQ